ncbi:Transcriptional regulator form adherence 5 [Ceratocystis fimbriata CBS 114723]|uniref:Transcriptional regulator form adherence 5 n=1 Tax=Ceratocystis fimbriata CBS 114723 TaxID=1035309 RepID=A0A2C5X2K2_9PEZI|nr:Transcriptional regulator form adherence 5 [Ceratocystis fimbriata CBS 114723]
MPAAGVATLPPAATANPPAASVKKTAANAPERKYKCQFCNRAFSRSEHRSRHERSHTKERPFKCMKCRSTFVRRDLLLRHDRTVHAKDGGVPLHSDGKRRAGPKSRATATSTSASSKASIPLDQSALEQIESVSDNAFDIEAAAMLVADMQQKAMRDSAGPFEGDTSGAYPRGNTAVEHTGVYSNGPIAVGQQMAWEFMPQGARENTAHSVASTSASFDSQPSFGSSNGTAPPQPSRRLPPLNGLVPALQSMISSLSPSEAPTSAPQTPLDMQSVPASCFKVPFVASEEERSIIMENIHSIDTERAVPDGFRLSSLSSLNRYLSTYFGLFHHHLPFLHPSSFVPSQVAPALLLSILSIGALYSFDQDEAYLMHIGSKILVNQFLQHKENFSSRKCPLWTMQSSLLNMVFASWSGDAKGLEWTCSIKSLLANMVAGNRYELKLRQEARGNALPSRAEWIEDEGCRRTYYAVYIFFGLLTMTFNHTPVITFNEFENLQLPSTEALWNAGHMDETVWHEQLRASHVPTFIEAHVSLVQGQPMRYSSFATRTLINALFLEVWYHKRSPEALQDMVTEYKLRLALETWEKSIDMCEQESVSVPLSSPHQGHHPLIFNAKAMYRNALCRLEVDLKPVQEALRYHDSYEVAAAMSNARDRVKRSSEMLKVIELSYATIETCVSQGVRWVARTSPTNWSIEHPLAGLDMMIILSMWLYRLEHDGEPTTPQEMAMYNKLRALLERECAEHRVNQLSSVVARLWGSMLDEVVVWGIARLMGESFRLHSQALIGYVDDIEGYSNASTPSMVSQGVDEDSVY